MKQEQFTILVYTENKVGLLQRVAMTFSRRKINIESLNTSESEVAGIWRFTIVVNSTEEWVRKTVANIDKQVEVHRAFYYRDTDIVYQEIALYKVPTEVLAAGGQAEKLVRKHHARVLTVEKDFTILEKTGHKDETQELCDALEPFGLLEFVRSGRVAITRPMRELQEYLDEIELAIQQG